MSFKFKRINLRPTFLHFNTVLALLMVFGCVCVLLLRSSILKAASYFDSDTDHPIWSKAYSRDVLDYMNMEEHSASLKPKAFEQACSEDNGLAWIFVSSAPGHFERRRVIRETWGKTNSNGDAEFREIALGKKKTMKAPTDLRTMVRISFVVGRSEDGNLQHLLEEESVIYGDILQEDFEDTYNMLVIKTLYILKWAYRNECVRSYKFIVKCDDDVFVNLPNLIQFLRGGSLPWLDTALTEEDRKHLIWGKLVSEPVVSRDVKSKFYMPRYIFKDDMYPQYVNGPFYILSQSVISCILQQAVEEPFNPMEDVYVTGILAEKCGYSRLHNGLFRIHLKNYDDICSHRSCLVEHLGKDHADLLPKIFKDFYDPRKKC